MKDQTPLVIETTEEDFARDVIEPSQERLVIVDFWAEWCAPCRTLGPILEKLAREFDGKLLLVKAQTEHLPRIAAEFGVRSIPAVFALRDGKIVDSFVGALPESSIRAWIDHLLPSPAQTALADAKRLEAIDAEEAEAKYRSVVALAPAEPSAKIGLARLLSKRGQDDEARALIAELERRGFLEPEAEKLKAELGLKKQAGQIGSVAGAQANLAASPNDLNAKLELAEALAAEGHHEESLELCLALVENDRKGVGETARKLMLNLFQVLPADSELTRNYRRQLATALF